MKKDIHPQYNSNLVVTCSCGNSFTTGSTLQDDSVTIDICSKCHPFYTGEQKIVDTDNVVRKFEERLEKSKKMSFSSKKEKMAKRRAKRENISSKPAKTLSLREMKENEKINK